MRADPNSSDGTPAVHVATLGAGETFGAVSALRGTPRTTTVETVTRVRLRTLSGETLDALAAALPGVRDIWTTGSLSTTITISRTRRRPSTSGARRPPSPVVLSTHQRGSSRNATSIRR